MHGLDPGRPQWRRLLKGAIVLETATGGADECAAPGPGPTQKGAGRSAEGRQPVRFASV